VCPESKTFELNRRVRDVRPGGCVQSTIRGWRDGHCLAVCENVCPQIHPQIQSEIGPRNFRVEGLLSVYMMRVCTAVYGIATDILGENGERGEHEDGNEEDRTGDSTL